MSFSMAHTPYGMPQMYSQYPQQTQFDVNKYYARNREIKHPTQNVNIHQNYVDNVTHTQPYNYNIDYKVHTNNYYRYPTQVQYQKPTYSSQNYYAPTPQIDLKPLPGYNSVDAGGFQQNFNAFNNQGYSNTPGNGFGPPSTYGAQPSYGGYQQPRYGGYQQPQQYGGGYGQQGNFGAQSGGFANFFQNAMQRAAG